MLDRILRKIGLTTLSVFDHMANERAGWRSRALIAERRCRELEQKYDEADLEGKARYASPDGKKVLKDLQRALNYLRDYQRAMWVVLAPDNNYYLTKELLEAWGMKPHSQVNDFYAQGNRGIPKQDRTGQDYDSYGVQFVHDESKEVLTYEDIDPDDPNFKTDLRITRPKPPLLLESPDDE